MRRRVCPEISTDIVSALLSALLCAWTAALPNSSGATANAPAIHHLDMRLPPRACTGGFAAERIPASTALLLRPREKEQRRAWPSRKPPLQQDHGRKLQSARRRTCLAFGQGAVTRRVGSVGRGSLSPPARALPQAVRGPDHPGRRLRDRRSAGFDGHQK